MKKQILSLIFGAAVLAASPVFAMFQDGDLEGSSTKKVHITPLLKMSPEELEEAIKEAISGINKTVLPSFAFEKTFPIQDSNPELCKKAILQGFLKSTNTLIPLKDVGYSPLIVGYKDEINVATGEANLK